MRTKSLVGVILGAGVLVGTCSTRVAAQLRLTAAPPTALLGAWAMSNTLDTSGNNRTATFTNLTTVPGKFAEAQRFIAPGSRMTVPTFNVGAAFTLEAWVLINQNTRSVVAAPRDAPAAWQAIIYKGYDDFFLAEAGGFYSAGFQPAGGGPLVQILSPTKLAVPGGFHHVAATYDGTTVALFVDGNLVSSGPATGMVANSTQPIEVGGSAADAGGLDGIIDDVRIYGRALPSSEILTDMATPVDTVREAVVSWDLAVYNKGQTPADGMYMAQGNFLKSAALCNLAPTTTPIPPVAVRNPKLARLGDPVNAGRECEIVIETFILALPVGTGYTATASARGATTVSAPSGLSNPFDRVAVVNPPLSPGTPPRVLP